MNDIPNTRPSSQDERHLPSARLNAWCEEVIDVARRVTTAQPAPVFMPVLALYLAAPRTGGSAAPTRAMVALPDFDESEFEQAMPALGAQMAVQYPGLYCVAAVFLAESWARILTEEQVAAEQAAGGVVDPEDAADRIDAITLACLSIDGRTASIAVRTGRDDAGNMVLTDALHHLPAPSSTPPPRILEAFYEGWALGTAGWLGATADPN